MNKSEGMQIAYLVQNGLEIERNSGPKIHIEAVIKVLRKLGNKVVLLALQPGRKIVEDQRGDGLRELGLGVSGFGLFILFEKVIRFTQSKLKLPFLGLFDSIRFKEACLNYGEGYDLFYERYTAMGFGGAWASKVANTPLVLEVNADMINLEAPLHGQRISRVQYRIAEFVTKISFNQASKIIAVSTAIKSQLIRAWNIDPAKIVVVPNGVDVEMFDPNKVFAADEKTALKPLGGHLVLFTGSFLPWHGVDILIRAFSEIEKDYPLTRLLLIGDGPTLKSMQDLSIDLGIREKVFFIGEVPHKEIPEYLKAADICVAPYKELPVDLWFSPLKLFEYMAMAKPIIASNAGQISDVIDSEVSGLLVKPDNIEDLSNSIVRLLESDVLRESLGKNAQKIAREKYSWDEQVKKIEKVLEEVVNGKTVNNSS